jgi:hypothetical protein
MNRHLVDALTQLYPASWRRRYAAEFSAFLEESKCGIRDVADILWSALREHLLSKGEREMNRSQHASGSLAFSFLASLAAGINLVLTVDDSPLIDAMRSHMGMSVAWNLLAGAAVLSGIGVLSIVFSLYRSILFYARRAGRRDILALLSVPFIGAGALLLWGACGLAHTGGRWAASPWAILSGGGAPSFWPSLHARWICGIISVVLSITVAIASAISVHLAIRRTDFELANGTALRERRALAVLAKPLVVICTVVMFLSVLAWGLALQRSVPSLFRQHVGLLDGAAATSWVISLSLLGLASAICIRTNLNLKNAH